MKKALSTAGLILILGLQPQRSDAQIPGVGLVTGIIKKVIIALDLKVQELQNQTLKVQNLQQQLENKLSMGSLNDISGWLNKEKELYQGYYQELNTVKGIIAGYREVKAIIRRQKQLLDEYRTAYALFRRDRHFRTEELQYMDNIYSGILEESLRNLDDLTLAVSSFRTQMTDAERMQRIHQASGTMQTNLDHLRQFNQQNKMLSLARSASEQDRQGVRNLYGL
ncbi:conjugal transfer protein TraI [Mucilaginibacter litoreus]|uniref:Conjugal transfer protein TraI n=1 Tax=Mucilaginibacter litoreus TaxID=1048221 RepID=A0ABW3AWY7_9SPHI